MLRYYLTESMRDPGRVLQAIGRRTAHLGRQLAGQERLGAPLAQPPIAELYALCEARPDDERMWMGLAARQEAEGDPQAAMDTLLRIGARTSSHALRREVTRLALDLHTPDQAMDHLDRLAPTSGGDKPEHLRPLAMALLTHKRVDLAAARCAQAFGQTCTTLSMADDAEGIYSVMLKFDRTGFEIRFAKDFLFWPFLLERLATYSAYLDDFVRTERPVGEIRFSVGDGPDGVGPQLCFSGCSAEHFPVPDPIFLMTDGYLDFRRNALRHGRPWSKRKDLAYWRGSLTGMASDYAGIMQLPRIKLSLISKHSPLVDARITSLNQYGPLLPTLQFICEGLDILAPQDDPARNLDFRYLIDVDGNTNSWPGLYTKLASGGAVIKLRSELRQWYYDDLVHDRNVIFVDSLDELIPAIERCRAIPARMEQIARAAVALARLTPKSEYEKFASSLRAALALRS